MTLADIKALPVSDIADHKAHLYLWIPNALLPEGLAVMVLGGLSTREMLFGKKFGKMGCLMEEAWAFISATLQKFCFLASKRKVRQIERCPQPVHRLI